MPRSLILAYKRVSYVAVLCSGRSYLGKGAGIKLVLGGNFQANIASRGRVPSGLRASLDLSVDFVVVAGREDAQVVGSSDSGSV